MVLGLLRCLQDAVKNERRQLNGLCALDKRSDLTPGMARHRAEARIDDLFDLNLSGQGPVRPRPMARPSASSRHSCGNGSMPSRSFHRSPE
jgi:hypothetical protein